MRNILPARVVRIRPSRLQRWGLVVVALLALASIALAELPPPGRLAATLITGLVAWHAWRRPEVVALRPNPDGGLEWRAAGQDWQAANLLPDTYVTPWLCVLAFRSEGKTRRLPLYPDSLHPEDFRRLRVWLRWQARLEPAAQPAHGRQSA